MISFKEFLTESRSAPLYHATPSDAAAKIIKSNRLNVSWESGAISLTRSIDFAKTHLDYHHGSSLDDMVVFELDQNKLRNSYKIRPYNDFPFKSRYLNVKPGEDDRGWNEYEERVSGGRFDGVIKDFDNYVTKVIVFIKPGKPIKGNLILNHPKLYYNGKFVNK